MPQRLFERKLDGTKSQHSDLDECKPENSSVKCETNEFSDCFKVPNRIFVGGLSSNTDEWDVRAKFSRYGRVKFVKIIRDNMGSSKGYGFVTFETEEETKSIIEKNQAITIRGRKLNIAPAVKRQRNQSDSCSTEKSSIESLQDVSKSVCLHTKSRKSLKTKFFDSDDSDQNAANWNGAYLTEPTRYLSATNLNVPEHLVNGQIILPYPTLVYVPQYSYPQTTGGITYVMYGNYPDLIPLVQASSVSSDSINAEIK